MLLTRGIRGSEGNPAGFHFSPSERIIDALVFRAAGGATWIFVVFVISRFGHICLQLHSAAYHESRPAEAGASLTTQGPHRFAVQVRQAGAVWSQGVQR
jgi:hypothetical protein